MKGKKTRTRLQFCKLTFYKNFIFIKVAPFPSTYYQTPLKDYEVRGAIVAAISHVRTSAMLLLDIVGIKKDRCWKTIEWHNIHTKFCQHRPISKGEIGYKEKHRAQCSH